MTRNTYIAIHTYISDEIKRQSLTPPNKDDMQTDAEWSEKWTFEKCKCIATWIGNDDFFFCHREAEDEQDIHNSLAENGLDKFVVTACYRAHSHIDTKNLTGEIRNYPPWVD